MTNHAVQRVFQHDPYSVRVLPDSDFNTTPRSLSPGPMQHVDEVTPGTLHVSLQGRLNFIPYPTTTNAVPFFYPRMPKHCMTRVFVGQLPYGTTPEQLQWIVYEVAQCPVFFTETIHNWTGEKQSKGCVHTYCYPDDVDYIVEKLHRHALVDDTGIWVAETDEEYFVLEQYCKEMKHDKTKRFHQRPSQPVVAQRATSTFIPNTRGESNSPSTAVPPPYVPIDMSPPPYYAGIEFQA